MTLLDPYPGESLRVYRGWSSGVDPYPSVRFRDGSDTLASGETWKLWFDAFENGSANVYLDDDTIPVDVSWVVEVTAGSGTLVASEGEDPTFSDDGVATPTALGTVTVTGPGTYLIPATIFGAVEIVDPSTTPAYVLALQCTSGSITVEQVKVRVWPPGGAPGGFSAPLPGFTTAYQLPTVSGAPTDRGTFDSGVDTQQAAWEFAVAGAPSLGGGAGPWTTSPTGPGSTTVGGTTWRKYTPANTGGVSLIGSAGGTMAIVSAFVDGAIAVLQGPDDAIQSPVNPTLVNGVDYIRPPEEVPGDIGALALSLGSPSWTWENTTATVVASGDASTPLPELGITVASGSESPDPISGGAVNLPMVDSGTAIMQAATDTTTPIALTATDRWVVVYVSTTLVTDPPDWPGFAPITGTAGWDVPSVLHFGSGPLTSSFAPMRAAIVMPSYRVWNPTVTTVPPLRQRNRGRPRARLHADRQRSVRARGFL